MFVVRVLGEATHRASLNRGFQRALIMTSELELGGHHCKKKKQLVAVLFIYCCWADLYLPL